MILEKIMSIFMVMAIGFAARKLKAVEAEFLRGLSAFMINIALPFAFVGALDRSIPRSVLPELGVMFLWALAVHLVSIGIAGVAYRRFPENQRKILAFVTVFGNSAFMGLPVAQSLAGSRGIMFASIYNVMYGILIYTYGISLFEESKGSGTWKRIVFNPGIIGIVLGFFFWLAPFSLPGFMLESIGLMAKLQTPLAMFIVGANIAMIDLKGITSWKAILMAIAMRNFLIPLAVFAVIRLSGATGLAPEITMMMAAMPAAAQTVVMAEKAGGDSTFASEVVLTTTLASILSIPLFAGFVG